MRKHLLAMVLFVGCGSSQSSSSGAAGPFPTPASSLEIQRREVIETYFPSGLVEQMHRDAAPIESSYAGTRPFSTAQYAQSFVLATLPEVYDVFDARIPANLDHFHQWAESQGLVLSQPPRLTYWTYSQAATAFLQEFGFDAVVFHPDEYHPAFTRSDDTWAFVREDSLQGPGTYYSRRFLERRQSIRGGIAMQPVPSDTLWPFYIPLSGANYAVFQPVQANPVSAFAHPENLNPYQPGPATSAQQEERFKQGFLPNIHLSNRHQLLVGTWTGSLSSFVQDGFNFTSEAGLQDQYTWGSSGHYVLILEPDYWTR